MAPPWEVRAGTVALSARVGRGVVRDHAPGGWSVSGSVLAGESFSTSRNRITPGGEAPPVSEAPDVEESKDRT